MIGIFIRVQKNTSHNFTKFGRLTALGLPLSLFLLTTFPNLSFAQCTLFCKTSLNVSLPFNGEVQIPASLLLANAACDPSDFHVEITDESNMEIGDVVSCTQSGQSVTASVIHNTNGNSCETILNIFDYVAPQFDCRDTTILCINPYSPQDIGTPTIIENCTIASLTHTDQFIDLACLTINGSDTITSKIERSWIATDESGNTGTCLQTIFLKRATVDDVVFPVNRDGFLAPILDCNDDPTDLNLTGEPQVNGLPLSTGGNCEIVASKSDQQIDICGSGGYRILRTWTAIDYCTGAFKIHIQVIKVLDTTAPNIFCPDDITVGTNADNCLASVNLPLATATDDCSNIIITPTWAYGEGYGPFVNVPIGEHVVTYSAEDACGNISTCIMMVNVVDNIIPVVVCNGNLEVQLSTTGTAILNASSIDDGSQDNCGVDYFEASRDDINFGSSITFDCADANQSIMVSLRVFDIAGNYNSCTVSINVEDGVKPVIACPSNAYVQCVDDYTDLDLTGEAVAVDACGVDTLFYNDVIDLNSCQVGTITRTWTAKDINGNERSCLQTIFVEDNTPIEVIFPDAYNSDICGSSTDTMFTGQPIILNRDCELVTINYNDVLFDLSAPACYKIFRNWIVVDWCVYDPNSTSTEGYYTQTQIITITDNEAPLFNCLNDTLVGSLDPNCGGAYVTFDEVIASDCSEHISYSNNSPYADSNGANASGFYPMGVHVVEFEATDGCGNRSTCQMTVTVEDALPPSVSCLGSVSINIGADGKAVLTPAHINLSTYDNCTNNADLIFDLSQDTFTCTDFGIQNVELLVHDEKNNSSFCTTTVNIQDPLNICPPSVATLGGRILNEKSLPIAETMIYLTGDHMDSTMTDLDGNYIFSDLPLGGNYMVTPFKDIKFLNGINTLDLIYISQHILGINPLNSPYKRLAAEVNQSKSVTAFDMVEIRKVLLSLSDIYSGNESWRFIDASYTFLNPNKPYFEEYPEFISINGLAEDRDDIDFIAIKIGDVNVSHSPSQLTSGDTRSEEPGFLLETEDILLEAGEVYTIPFMAKSWEDIKGFQFGLEIDEEKGALLEFELNEHAQAKGLRIENFGKSNIDHGILTASWVNSASWNKEDSLILFNIKIRCIEDSHLSEMLKMNSHILMNESYKETTSGRIEPVSFDLEFFTPQKRTSNIWTYPSYPNPVQDYTKLGFELSEEACMTFILVDALGQKIWSDEECYGIGHHEIKIDRSQFGENRGVFYVKMSNSKGWTNTWKIIVAD